MLLDSDVVPGPDGHQMRVGVGDGDGGRPGVPSVRVAELVCEVLDLLSRGAIVIPEISVIEGPGCPLDPLVGERVEVILCGVGDVGIHRGASQDVLCPAQLVPVVRAE